jgi:hypothetical protein
MEGFYEAVLFETVTYMRYELGFASSTVFQGWNSSLSCFASS